MKKLFAGLVITLGFSALALNASHASSFSAPATVYSAASMQLAFLGNGSGTAANGSCRMTSDCNFGEFCLNGQCVIQAPGNRCEFKTDCPPAENCVNGVCRR